MRKFLALLVVPLVLVSSGCTVPVLNIEIPFLPDIWGGTEYHVERNDVIVIEKLQTVPSSVVRAGQSIRLRAEVKNMQEPQYDKIPVVIGLYNDCGLFGMGTSRVSGEYCSGSTPPVYNEQTGMVECMTEMYPQSTAVIEWKLTARDDINVETHCKIGILARYLYTTHSTSSVTFINRDEVDRLFSEGKSFAEKGIATLGEGPVKPYVEIPNQPIIIDASETDEPGGGIMSFWMENNGNGILDMAEASAEEGNVVFGCDNLNVFVGIPNSTGPTQISPPSSVLKKLCIEVTPGKETGGGEHLMANLGGQPVSIQECLQEHMRNKAGDGYSTNFINKKTPKYSCTITVADPSRIKQEKTYQITSKVGYSYKFTKDITVTVQPKIKL